MALVREAIPYVMSDYDGTMARTGETPTGGVDVNGAYKLAITELFDEQAAQDFEDNGGHRHRAPVEIITEIAQYLPGLQRADLERFAAQLTNTKLDILLAQIGKLNDDGTIWPRPTDGFVEFWNTLSSVRERRTIGSAVISAGHTAFIAKWFEVLDLQPPDASVSAEVLDNLMLQVELPKRVKPAPLPIELAKAALSVKYGNNAINTIYYIGDSEEKDGGLAINTDSDFTLVDETDAAPAWQLLGAKLQLPGYERPGA